MARWLPSSAVAAQCHDESDDSSSAAGPLTPAQVAAWRSSGVVVLQPGLLPPALVEAVRRDASLSFDDPAGPALADDALAFPSTASAAANAVTLHPRLLDAAARLLGVPLLSLLRKHHQQLAARGSRADSGQGGVQALEREQAAGLATG